MNEYLSLPNQPTNHTTSKHDNVEFVNKANITFRQPRKYSSICQLFERSMGSTLNMEWSNETIMEFLNLYENEPVVWNACHPLHKNRNEVFEGWKRIQQKLSIDCSVTELKKKKESLMARFRQCLGKVKQSTKNGAGTDGIYKPVWFAYEKMASFLKNKNESMEPLNSLRIATKLKFTNDTENNEDDDEDNDMKREHPHDDNSGGSKDTEILTNPGKASRAYSRVMDTFEASQRKKQKLSLEDTGKLQKQIDFNAFNITKASTLRKRKINTKDECAIYGALVASKLRKLDEVTRDYVMNQIDNFLFKAKSQQHSLNFECQQLQGNTRFFSPNNINPHYSLQLYPTKNQQFPFSRLPKQCSTSRSPSTLSSSQWMCSQASRCSLPKSSDSNPIATPFSSPSSSDVES
ncbi:hypothetical protein ABEB36_008029 [Hypothenemus hampei]|uniref:MADF domain-containing protein n=1 Tax=Hypothenemus hampei TaxID=57062 RepID=A0ABD1ENE4_HYPHA